VSGAGLCDTMFRRRHETLKAAITPRDATGGQLCQSITRLFRKFCLEHAWMLSELWPQPPTNKMIVAEKERAMKIVLTGIEKSPVFGAVEAKINIGTADRICG
jgi:hypothetical protein